ncbi:MAG: ABC transporter [Rhodospirillales bacterium]|nr:ABC transporter [Rhodospirillales bacterium]
MAASETPAVGTTEVHAEPVIRFWQMSRGFLAGKASFYPWALIGLLVLSVVLDLALQYRLNLWNRDFFNALDRRDGSIAWAQAQMLFVLVASSVAVAIVAVWGRMTFQRLWRRWLTPQLLSFWLSKNRGRFHCDTGATDFAEYRIVEDARVATDAPIDFMVGLLSSLLTAATFITVLWTVGGSIDLSLVGLETRIPGYLVIGVIIYSALTTIAMIAIGGRMGSVIEHKNEAESELKFTVARLREHLQMGDARSSIGPDVALATTALQKADLQWQALCGQHMRITLVSHGNNLLAPVMGLLLCLPNYVHGGMSLGEMTQSAAAFMAVHRAFNWLVDNYPRLAEWTSAATRVGVLLLRLDNCEADATSA